MKHHILSKQHPTITIIVILLLMNFSAIPLLSQEKVTYTGRIVDDVTKQPVELVAIYTLSGNTITNTDGEYELKCNENETISFSHISYHTQQISIQNLPAIIELKPKIFELAEVVVIPQAIIIKELKAVWNKYNTLLKGKKEKNFANHTFYYRQLTFNNDTCVEYIESFFTAPTTVSVRTMSLQEGRFARINKDNVFRMTNHFYLSQITPFSTEKAKTKKFNTFLCADFEKYYNVSIQRIISPDQPDEICVYEFTPIENKLLRNSVYPSGLLYIRSTDKAIIRMEANSNTLLLNTKKTMTAFDEHFNAIISYTETAEDAFPIVESVQTKLTLMAKNNATNEIRSANIQSTLLTTDYTFDTKGNQLKQRDVLLREIDRSTYNQEFWDNNVVVKRTKIEQQVLDDFNREGYFGTMNLDN